MAEFDEYDYLEQQLNPRKRSRDADEEQRPARGHDRDAEQRPGRPRDYPEDRAAHRGDRGDRGGRGYPGRHHGGHAYDGRGRGHYDGRGNDGYDRYDRSGRGPSSRPHRQRSRSPRRRAEMPPEVRLLKDKEKELKDMDRDLRTVFAYNLNLKANERDIYDFFSKAGRVGDVKLISDRSTKRSKGFAYIEFVKQESVLSAMALNNQTLLGQQVMVKSAEAEKNMAWEAAQQASASNLNAALLSGAPCRLLVSNLRVEVTEVNLRPLFEPFGALDSLEIHRDLAGASKGQASVQFKSFDDASRALQHLNGMDVAGLVLKITIVPPAGAAGGAPGLGDLEDEENAGGGLKLTSQTRAALMSRLASSAGLQVPAQGAGGAAGGKLVSAQLDSTLALDQGLLGPASPIPTVCLLLKNMFDPAQETDPGWEDEIANDVRDECSKFSAITHIYVDKSSKGHVYLKFALLEGSQAAQRTLHGRFFAGKQIAAEYQFVQPYNSHFRC